MWPASGTWGTFAAGLIYGGLYLLLVSWVEVPWWAFNVAIAVLILAGSAVGIALGPWAEKHYGRKDPSQFVLDEAVGYWLAMLFLPLAAGPKVVLTAMIVQFFLFRVADIIKPCPANRSQKLPHGWGIVVDDLLAAVYCNVIAQILFRTGVI